MGQLFARFANATSKFAGKPLTFIACVCLVLVWAASGPIFGFSETWQLIINTSTTIITFLMVFLVQNTQNRDNAAIQAKLDELIRCGDAQNKFIGIEHLSDKELEAILEEVEQNAKDLHEELKSRKEKEAKGEKPAARKSPAKKAPARKTQNA
jgi:low affinity Fe/Cu permease